ncbi:MAG: thioredoxin-disulfide reductase [Clostridia bacterium]|nr:thioredoxin-disulfide reductase [Clostridia bacterium]
MKHIYDVIIIGGGPGGYSAALYASRAGLDTLVIEKFSVGGQMTLTDVIDNYPGFEEGTDGISLGFKMQQSAERFGAKTEYDEVVGVSLAGEIKTVTSVSAEYKSKTVIIATGANPRELGIEKETELVGRGVHYCAHCDGRFYKDKTVVVVGGGNSAVEDALYLSRLAKKVWLVHRRDELRATKIYRDSLLKADNVEIIWNSRVTQLRSDKRLNGVQVENILNAEITDIVCDGVFVSIGRKPASELFKGQVEIDENGYIIADESGKTNVEGVFAVGDVRTKALRQVVTAVSDGATAAHFAEEYIIRN